MFNFNFNMGSLQYIINSIVRWWLGHPCYILIAAVIILFLGIFSMDARNTSALSWVAVIIAILLFFIGLSGLTGVGLGIFA